MSDGEIPVLRQAAKVATHQQENWKPGQLQERIKARFYRRLGEMAHVYDREAAFSSKEAMVELAGTDRILGWLEDPSFATWFTDSDMLVDIIQSEQTRSVLALIDIRDNLESSDGDRLKATRTLLELGDQFPGRKSEVRFLDDNLEAMNDRDVLKEQRKLQAKLDELGELEDIPTNADGDPDVTTEDN